MPFLRAMSRLPSGIRSGSSCGVLPKGRRARKERKRMDMNVFAKKVCDAIERELGCNYRAECREVRKNNGIILHGLVILSKERNVAPTIYLDSFREAYEAGMPFAIVIRRLLAIYWEDMPRKDIDMEFFKLFEKVKDRICYRLINREENVELLREVPYLEFLDLAICFYYAYQGKVLGEGSILITNSHMEMWKSSTAELLRLAQVNTPRLYPWACYSMQDILQEIDGGRHPEGKELFQEISGIEIPMRVLSNVKRTHGAACMIYPEVLRKLTEECRESFYILPSSVHEVIFLKNLKTGSEEALRKMIAEINRTQVAPEEVLSDQLYCYDINEKRIKTV